VLKELIVEFVSIGMLLLTNYVGVDYVCWRDDVNIYLVAMGLYVCGCLYVHMCVMMLVVLQVYIV